MGLSVLPPPAAIPTVALHNPFKVFLPPEGNLTLDLDPSSEWPIMVAYPPEALAKIPLSPGDYSKLQTTVPSGIAFKGKTFPMAMEALTPQYTY